jgi:hypothetical protein
MRPIFLRLADRTRAHAFVVMLAYQIREYLASCWNSLVKIFEPTFPPEVTLLPLPTLRLVFRSTANDDILGSCEFACQLAGAKVVLVMGHTACGAIKGAIDRVELGHVTGLLAKIRPAVEATQYEGERSAKHDGFVDAVARKHVGTCFMALDCP